jgi:cytochrome c556
MIKGEAPFDLAKAQGVFDVYVSSIGKFAMQFPAESKTGNETKASQKIWDDNAGFKAAVAKFEADAAAGKAATKDLDSFKVAFGAATQNCQSCHESYRLK